VTLIGGVTCTD